MKILHISFYQSKNSYRIIRHNYAILYETLLFTIYYRSQSHLVLLIRFLIQFTFILGYSQIVLNPKIILRLLRLQQQQTMLLYVFF